jgi:hypothetical protein
MLSGEWRESRSCYIAPLSDVDSNDFRAFLKYIYTTDTKLLEKRAWPIWELCDYFGMLASIKTEIFPYLLKSMTFTGANKYIPLINQNALFLAQEPSSAVAKELHQIFVEFIVSNSQSLVNAGFRFRDLEESVLNDIFEIVPNKK